MIIHITRFCTFSSTYKVGRIKSGTQSHHIYKFSTCRTCIASLWTTLFSSLLIYLKLQCWNQFCKPMISLNRLLRWASGSSPSASALMANIESLSIVNEYMPRGAHGCMPLNIANSSTSRGLLAIASGLVGCSHKHSSLFILEDITHSPLSIVLKKWHNQRLT